MIYWCTSSITNVYGVENFDMDCNSFKTHCKELVRRKLIESWKCELNDKDKNPILRMYKLIKTNFSMESYLNLIKKPNTDGRLKNYASALIIWKSSVEDIRNQWPLLSKDYVSCVVLLMMNCILSPHVKSIQQSEKDCIHMSILMCQISAAWIMRKDLYIS